MKKYRFRVTRKIIEETYVEVEGPEMILGEDLDWDGYEAKRQKDDKLHSDAVEKSKMSTDWKVVRITDPVAKPEPYNPDFDDDVKCECGHPYHRHFDSYDDMYPIGCKYCPCSIFSQRD